MSLSLVLILRNHYNSTANAAIKMTKFEKGLHKFRNLKRPKMKSLNIVKKINKTTKNKRKKRHFSKNFKGKVIDGVHELYTLTAGMMLGINHVVSGIQSYVHCTNDLFVPLQTSSESLSWRRRRSPIKKLHRKTLST